MVEMRKTRRSGEYGGFGNNSNLMKLTIRKFEATSAAGINRVTLSLAF